MYLDKRQPFARYCPVRQAYRDFRVMCLDKRQIFTRYCPGTSSVMPLCRAIMQERRTPCRCFSGSAPSSCRRWRKTVSELAYQRIREIFALACDYQEGEEDNKLFFATMQNKMNNAATGMTAADNHPQQRRLCQGQHGADRVEKRPGEGDGRCAGSLRMMAYASQACEPSACYQKKSGSPAILFGLPE
jgi:hypothetical protein